MNMNWIIQKLKYTKLYDLLRKIYHRYQKIQKEKRRKKNQLEPEQLNELLQKYDIISFDIFDTLITRKIYNPDDVFDLMGETLEISDFKKKRKDAENRAREELKKDVNLEEIYEYYQKITKSSPKLVKTIQETEERLELKLTTPRKDMRCLVETLKKQNKKMIIVSDMYLKKETIIKMLEACGYDISYFENIYISNEINKRKDTKEVWPYIKEKYPKETIIHLGDNDNSDVFFPKEFGIHTQKIKSSKELFQESELFSAMQPYLENLSLSDSIFIGFMIGHKLFNSPFNSLKIEQIKDLGYAFHGVVIYEFLKFLIQESKSCDTLLFLAREGYNLQKLYQFFCECQKISEKKSIYFLTSRKSTSTATIESIEDMEKLLQKEFHGTFQNFMDQVFCQKIEDDTEINLPNDFELVKEKITPFQEDILNSSKIEREAYLEYIKQNIPTFKTSELAIIDLGYSGTIQYNLTKLLKKEFHGIYLTNSSTVKRYNKNSKLNFCFDIKENENYKVIYYYSLVLEFFLSAPYGQLQRFQQKGKKIIPIYNSETLDDKKKKSIDNIFQSVKEYIQEISQIEEFYPLKINKSLIVTWYQNIIDSFIIDKKVKDQFDFMDSYEASKVRNVFKIISKY